MACATMRAFAKVKSSAMMSRQPSVPNLIEDMKNQYKRSGGERNSRIGWKSKWIQQKADLDRPLQKILELLRLQEFNEFGDVLGAVAGDDEERVGGFDDDEVVDTDGGDEFRGAVEEIAGRVERVAGADENIFSGLLGEEFIHGGPGADIAPADFCGDDEDLWRAGLLRGAFEDGVIHRDIF